jgi:hypothetical protein
MKPEQMRIKIAEACGWRHEPSRGDWCFQSPDGRYWHTSAGIPDYLNDLNAMHEAEKVLSDGQRMTYYGHLVSIARKSLGIDPCESHYQPKFTTHATAAQRAEAFLCTVGRWVES